MKKYIIATLICCMATNNSFGMLEELDIPTKDRSSRALVVHNRLKIKEGNAKAIPLMVKENEIIQQIEQFNRDMMPEEYATEEYKITSLAQNLLNIEREIQATRFKSRL